MGRHVSVFAPWSLRQLVDDLAAGREAPEHVRERVLARVAETEPALRAWVVPPFAGEGERDAASGPLAGVPMGVKDIIDVAGVPTRCGSALRDDAPPAAVDAEIVSRWRAAGALPVGKTVTTEFAFFAPGPTGNPAAPGHTPGGSSSGSAAAVASGQVPLAIGSQTAGSVTRPASFCGVAALVLSTGRVGTGGVVGLSHTLDAHGVYAARVDDLAVAWEALGGERVEPAAQPLRVLVWRADEFDVDPGMRAALASAADALRAGGAVVDELPIADAVAAAATRHPVVMAYEAARERAAELAAADRLSTPLRDLLQRGAATPAADYEAALEALAETKAEVQGLWAEWDVVLGPAALGAAPAGLGATGDPVLSRPWQAWGLPVVTIPGLRDADGLPLGLQAVGRPCGESALIAAAQRVEELLPAS
ncbi:MAG: amidase [Microbacterium sp.]|uniref:amidase family protein n=1 Tax=Microbacterium sp. TaxID=51671 RepID=UPI0039E6BBC2